MNTEKLLTFILIPALLTLFLPSATLAQENSATPPPVLTIAPSIIELEVKPGEDYERTISVTNGTEFPLPVTTDFKDYTMDEVGMPDYFDDTSGWSPRNWITVEPGDFILRDNEKHEILLKFHIPEKAQSGSHIAALFFQPVLPPDYFTAQSAHVVPYIGAIIALDVRSGDEEERTDYLEIQSFGYTPEEDEPDTFNFSARIYNDDVYFHRVGGTLEIYNFHDKKVHSELIGDITLLPEKIRSIQEELSGNLLPGKYRADLILGSEKEGQDESSLTFWIMPNTLQWLILLAGLIFILLLLWFLYYKLFRRKILTKILSTALPEGRKRH